LTLGPLKFARIAKLTVTNVLGRLIAWNVFPGSLGVKLIKNAKKAARMDIFKFKMLQEYQLANPASKIALLALLENFY